MGAAHELDAKVWIVGDLTSGGAFAALLGSLEVMGRTNAEDVKLMRGFILNKFRGDVPKVAEI